MPQQGGSYRWCARSSASFMSISRFSKGLLSSHRYRTCFPVEADPSDHICIAANIFWAHWKFFVKIIFAYASDVRDYDWWKECDVCAAKIPGGASHYQCKGNCAHDICSVCYEKRRWLFMEEEPNSCRKPFSAATLTTSSRRRFTPKYNDPGRLIFSRTKDSSPRTVDVAFFSRWPFELGYFWNTRESGRHWCMLPLW